MISIEILVGRILLDWISDFLLCGGGEVELKVFVESVAIHKKGSKSTIEGKHQQKRGAKKGGNKITMVFVRGCAVGCISVQSTCKLY